MSISQTEVEQRMKLFEDAYNLNEPQCAAALYAPKCLVTVNGGTEKGGPFTGSNPGEVAGFLGALRNDMGGTGMKFTITKVSDNVHEDTWVADNGTGSCIATWEQQDGRWVMVKDEITFVPKAQ
eukprot:GFYU01023493.1.p1 GENE.GFYU01023493.1~~GFYU01023493.1.p1  ORF type:complete len:124 (+),score=47.21 GFYU01023493.1:61-432(+)